MIKAKNAFPYLSKDELSLLTFPHLCKAKKHWNTLFDIHLQKNLYSPTQNAIWHLFQHICIADDQKRFNIMSQERAKDVLCSDPDFFARVIQLVNPSHKPTAKFLRDIFKQSILQPQIAQQLDNGNIKSVLKSVSLGTKMTAAITQELHIDSVLSERTPYEAFRKTGSQRIHTVQEWLTYLKQSIDDKDMALAEWFQGYMSDQIEALISHPQFLEMLDELYSLKAKSILHSIDNFYTNARPYPAFESAKFEQNYLLACKYQLHAFTDGLRAHFEASLLEYTLPTNTLSLCKMVDLMYNKINTLFANEQGPLLIVLRDKITSFLETSPSEIENLVDAVMETKNQWLLDHINTVNRDNPALFSCYWLSPLNQIVIDEDL